MPRRLTKGREMGKLDASASRIGSALGCGASLTPSAGCARLRRMLSSG
jgi:hypothetical protein